jgi:phosphorylcholine metabolism protein LicD
VHRTGSSTLDAFKRIIPWGDDLGINMPRKDFNRFSELVFHQAAVTPFLPMSA